LGVTLYLEGIFYGTKRTNISPLYGGIQTKSYSLYENEGMSYQAVAKKLGIPSCTQIKVWVKKYRNGESLGDQRGKHVNKESIGWSSKNEI
jgi:hypothetical protein